MSSSSCSATTASYTTQRTHPNYRIAVAGKWADAASVLTIPDPLNGEPFTYIPDTQGAELQPFISSLKAVPKSGLHNPLKKPERWGTGIAASGGSWSRTAGKQSRGGLCGPTAWRCGRPPMICNEPVNTQLLCR